MNSKWKLKQTNSNKYTCSDSDDHNFGIIFCCSIIQYDTHPIRADLARSHGNLQRSKARTGHSFPTKLDHAPQTMELGLTTHIINKTYYYLAKKSLSYLLSSTACGLWKLLLVCEEYAIQHGLKNNVSKSQYMVFEPSCDQIFEVPPINVNGFPLERMRSFKHLGHVVTADFKRIITIERERWALSLRANMVSCKIARCTSEVKVTLFGAYFTYRYLYVQLVVVLR